MEFSDIEKKHLHRQSNLFILKIQKIWLKNCNMGTRLSEEFTYIFSF